jgi:SAM-dependent methyltransferase
MKKTFILSEMKKVENEPGEYWEKRLAENWGLQGVGYIGLGRHYNYWLYRIQKRVFLRLAKRLTVEFSKASVLDIGSGTGFYAGLWRKLGIRSLTATDITQTAVQKLQHKFSDSECRLLDIGTPLPAEFAGRNYDLISAFAVLYHIADDEHYRMAIRNIHRLLKPGGTFIFSENFIHGPTIRAPYQVDRSLAEITRLLQETGFRIRKRVPIFVIMNYPVDSRSRLRKLFWRSLSGSIRKIPFLGFLWGMLLYPLDLLFSRFIKEGASTEIMICEK